MDDDEADDRRGEDGHLGPGPSCWPVEQARILDSLPEGRTVTDLASIGVHGNTK